MITEEKVIELINELPKKHRILYQGVNIDNFIRHISTIDNAINILEPDYKKFNPLMDTGLFDTVINDSIYGYDMVINYDIVILDNVNLIDVATFKEWLQNVTGEYKKLIIVLNKNLDYGLTNEYLLKTGFKTFKPNNEDIIAFK
jgi:hypothetical protein